MKYVSYITDSCKLDAQRHNLLGKIERLAEKIEIDQSIQNLKRFFPYPYLKKEFGSSYRLVCAEQVIDDDLVVISFLFCVPRSNAAYKKFYEDPAVVPEHQLPTKQELKDYLSNREEVLSHSLLTLSDNEKNFLYAYVEKITSDDLYIFESDEWINSMQESNFYDENTRFYDLMMELVNNQRYINETKISSRLVPVSIVYRFIPDHKVLFIAAPILGETFSKEQIVKSKYADIFNNKAILKEDLIKHTKRSFPSIALADSKVWRAIQKSEQGNLALSPEESKILDVVSRNNFKDPKFPLFINGRPGSGKSTILQYLYAELLCRYLQDKPEKRISSPPIYLTYSDTLIKSAKESVMTIFKCNVGLSTLDLDLTSKQNEEVLDKCFGVFHKFLFTLLPEEKKNDFQENNKIGFSTFRQLWDEKRRMHPIPSVRKISPEIAWHVIRTYIKGMKSDDESGFTPESYEELPASSTSVPKSIFEGVNKYVWEDWYKDLCASKGFWDEQDLVFEVLQNNLIDISRYPAIFCDEAQDFSVIELELILKLNLYSKRSLTMQDLKMVPFAFAGDPFQTLNPTGFNWESVQSNFHQKIVQGLDKASRSLDFNYQELSYNYRSTKNIVGLCNLLQLIRGILFDQRDIRPQKSWFNTVSLMPVFFDLKDPECQQKIKEQTELVFILPCQDGEEDDFVKDDPFLSEIVSETGPRNFLSPMSAKGLEFSRVVLYRFGSVCHAMYPDLFKPLETRIPHMDKDKSLPYEYFINSLYVGLSRAKNRLIIVDDEKGIEELWDKDEIKSIDTLVNLYHSSERYGWKTEFVNYVQPGILESWSEDRDDPIIIGGQLQDVGKAQKDPYKLKLAENNFLRAGEKSRADLCRAERLEIEEKFVQSGEVYELLNNPRKALSLYWKAKSYSHIANNKKFSDSVEKRAAAFMVGDKSIIECTRFLSFLCEEIRAGNKNHILSDPIWIEILDELISDLSRLKDVENWKVIYGQVSFLQENGLKPTNLRGFGEIAFQAEQYADAVDKWSQAKGSIINTIRYNEAKAHCAVYPENIKLFYDAKLYKKVIEKWLANTEIDIKNSEVRIVVSSMINENQVQQAVDLYNQYKDETILKKVLVALPKDNNDPVNKKMEKIIIETLKESISQDKWKDAINMTKNKIFNNAQKKKLIQEITYLIAVNSPDNFSKEDKNLISNFLKDQYIDKKWKNVVPIHIAGAAIEKAHKIIDSLEFYEMIWDKGTIEAREEEKNHALERWLKCKSKYIVYLQSRGISDVERHKKEIEVLLKDNPEIDLKTMPEFPFIKGQKQKAKTKEHPINQKTQEGILALHKIGWTIEEIAESFKIDKRKISQVVHSK